MGPWVFTLAFMQVWIIDRSREQSQEFDELIFNLRLLDLRYFCWVQSLHFETIKLELIEILLVDSSHKFAMELQDLKDLFVKPNGKT